MAQHFDTLTPELEDWLGQQKLFFVATAPLSADGHVNCSPKGGDTFRVLGGREVAYLDFTGSGIETAAHLQDNGRIVIMFCAFAGAPHIVRLHGKGRVIYSDTTDFERLAALFPNSVATRAIIAVTLTRISDSCGFGVPLLDFVGPRDVLEKWANQKGAEALSEYRATKNRTSIDGLPGHQKG
jgi:hypothetical protein